MLSKALEYLKQGYSVVPQDREKRALIQWTEYQKRLPTEEEVNKWWSIWKDANIAVVCGKVSGITAVDLDVKRDDKGNIVERGDSKPFPLTVMNESGGGGLHLFYKYTPEINSCRLAPLVEIKNDGSLITLPPSVHHTGNLYKKIRSGNMAEFPKHIRPIQKQNQTEWSEVVGGVDTGSRNETAAKVSGKLLRTFEPKEWESVAWSMLKGWNLSNNPPLPESELRAVFRSVAKRSLQNDPREVPDDIKEWTEEDSELALISEVAKAQSDTFVRTFKTGYEIIDNALLGGFREGDLVVVSGISGQGKTLMAQTLTYHMAMNQVPTLWFSFEVLASELWRNFKEMGVEESFISYSPFRNVSGNVEWIEKKVKESKAKFGCKAVFIDHLGFLMKNQKDYDKNASSNFSAYLGAICRELKSIALKEGVMIFLLAHTRKPMGNEEAGMNDIGFSVGISQEADVVMMINRIPEKQEKKKGSLVKEVTGYDEEVQEVYTPYSKLKIVKNRRTGQNKIIIVEKQQGRLVEKNSWGDFK